MALLVLWETPSAPAPLMGEFNYYFTRITRVQAYHSTTTLPISLIIYYVISSAEESGLWKTGRCDMLQRDDYYVTPNRPSGTVLRRASSLKAYGGNKHLDSVLFI